MTYAKFPHGYTVNVDPKTNEYLQSMKPGTVAAWMRKAFELQMNIERQKEKPNMNYDPFHENEDDVIELAVEIEYVTEMAVKITEQIDDDDVWIPKSQIRNVDPDDLLPGRSLTIEIPQWLALEKGLI